MSKSVAVALFGSKARGDVDDLSDTDLLVVADSRSSAEHVIRRAESRGCHPTFFAWDRLLLCARDGDLFVRHLQLESRILSDPDATLAHTLASFRHPSSYRERFRKASELLLALQVVPDHPNTGLWLLDAAAVGYRALAVARLAEAGLACFSARDIRRGLVRIGAVRVSEPDTYRWLRHCKSLYRSGASAQFPVSQVLSRAYATIDKTFHLGAHFRLVEPEAFAAMSVQSGAASLGWYARSRRLEGLLHLVASSEPETQLVLNTIRRGLIPPSDYGSSIAASLPEWERIVSAIANRRGTSVVPINAAAYTCAFPQKGARLAA